MDDDAGRRVERRLRAVAVVCAAVSVVLCVTAVVLVVVARSRGLDVRAPNAGDVVVGSLFPLAGLLVLWRQPRNACGWVLLSCTSIAVSTLSQAWVGVSTAGAQPLPGTGAAVWLSAWTFAPYWAQPVLLPLLFPHGRLPSARWRPFARVVAVLLVLLVLAAAFGPNDDVSDMGEPNPLGLFFLPVALGWAVVGVQVVSGLLLWLVAAPVALVGLVHRQRRATGVERAQLQWLLLGFVALLALTVASVPLDRPVSEVAFALGFAAVPLCLVVAVVRHRLLDVEVVVNRTIVYAGLTVASVVGYLAVVALAGRWLGVQGAAPVVAGAVVAVAAAARTRVQRWVDRRLFGSRGDPYEVVRSVGASTAAADAPDAALAALVATVHAALRVPFVQVLDRDGASVAEAGEPVAGTHVHPVVDRGRQLGVLVVGRRSPREKLRADEQSALHEVARRAGALLSSRQLSADLQGSYEQLFRVREEERRRLRRELHDGVGPALAGTALQLDSLAGRLRDQPELAQRAERLRDRLQSTVSEVRRIVDGLRPAALDELGLPAALQAFATDADDPVEVAVSTDLPDRLPAGVEAAAYRIAGEAVANALRHGGGRRASVTARVVDDELHLDVVDDGTGFGTGATAGVGLQSMHDRAAEVGGTLVVDSAPGSGTAVRAVLPLQRR